MRLPRRRFLAAGLATLLSACAPLNQRIAAPRLQAEWPEPADGRAWRLLSRATFGPHPLERARIAAIGADAWLEEQLAPETIDDFELSIRLGSLASLTADASSIYEWREAEAAQELQQATLLRAIYSRRQLYEVMVDFWSDHFSIALSKTECGWLKPLDDRAVIRPHALGRFEDLLRASLHSPAMLVYLDNGANRVGRPNENYARELLELHSLGVDGGYTQRDVQEAARCLTGWGVGEGPFAAQQRFDQEAHDDGPKRVLETAIAAGGGARDPDRVVDLALAHPATPRRIVLKLARRFLGPNPPLDVRARAETTFRATHGDIRATLRAILLSPAMLEAPPRFKRPLSFIAGAIRQLNGETDGGPALLAQLTRMGQPLFDWPTPDGFPEADDAWSATLLQRWQAALLLANNGIAGTTIDIAHLQERSQADTPAAFVDRLSTVLTGNRLPAAERAAILGALGTHLDEATARTAVAILLAMPAYQWR